MHAPMGVASTLATRYNRALYTALIADYQIYSIIELLHMRRAILLHTADMMLPSHMHVVKRSAGNLFSSKRYQGL